MTTESKSRAILKWQRKYRKEGLAFGVVWLFGEDAERAKQAAEKYGGKSAALRALLKKEFE